MAGELNVRDLNSGCRNTQPRFTGDHPVYIEYSGRHIGYLAGRHPGCDLRPFKEGRYQNLLVLLLIYNMPFAFYRGKHCV